MSLQRYEETASTALATIQDQAVQRLADWAHSADAAYAVAQRLSDSAFVPAQFRGKPVETTAAILAGLEVGLQPMAALRSFDIIQGQATARAITLRAVVQAQGHEMVLVESTASRCRMKGKRKGSDEWQTVTWTIDRAKDLGLTGKDNWKKQPAAMLTARATSELARLIASDAILGISYSAEEVADGGAYDQQVGEVTTTPAATGGTRKMSRPVRVVQDVQDDEPPAEESPYLNTSSALAKHMFASMNDLGVTEREDRLDFVNDVLGLQGDDRITTSTEMTDAQAEKVIAFAEERKAAIGDPSCGH